MSGGPRGRTSGRGRRPAPPFRKILVANRGEIACRVIRTCRRMGISTVAVYSEADCSALHVRMADEVVCVGPAPATQSYLDIERMVHACRETGAQAVHPGYGFLAENASFATAVEEAGMVFIGPGPEAIELMGDKLASKRAAARAGVSLVPGHDGVVASLEEALAAARSIGYPVMIKASAGGGGKGMRIARDDAECQEGFERARGEAIASFGDGRLLVERFIERPRHIEIQVLADAHGNVIHLGERECSIQRRHQKVVEEAPSPAIDPATRRAMGEQALALARAVGYRSAGTVEFVVDPDRRFYFLEMNTRLQVEHTVTELVTGLDLVELMIRIAAGDPLPLSQEDVRVRGAALEVRIYAEEPARAFLPSSGRLYTFRPPVGAGVRLDTGVEEGDTVPVHYDPMLAKLIAHGRTRAAAIAGMRSALDAFRIEGVGHNLRFLAAIVSHPRFLAGDVDTDFVADAYPGGFRPATLASEDPLPLLAVTACVYARCCRRESATGRRAFDARTSCVILAGGDQYPLEVRSAEGSDEVQWSGRACTVHSEWGPCDPLFRGTVDGRELCVQVTPRGTGYRIVSGSVDAVYTVLPPRAAELMRFMPEKERADASRLRSPMAGRLVRVAVGAGERVRAGQAVAVMEAMKTEFTLRAPFDSVVATILVATGAQLAADQAIMEMKETES